MPPVQESESGPNTFLDEDLDEKALFQLSWFDVFARVFSDIQPVPEPEVSSHPVVNINYSSDFDLVMGKYRALRQTMTSLYSPRASPLGAQTSLSAIGGRAACAKWMLLLAFALRQCIANYTVWKDRRDFIFCTAMFQWATQEQIPPTDFNKPPSHPSSKIEPAVLSEGEKKLQQLKYKDLVQRWLPQREDLAAPRHGGSKGVEHWLSLWQAVRWELQAIGCFSRLYHKNFQVWHHRKELLNHVLKSMDTDDAKFSSVMATASNFEDYLLKEHDMTFAEIDERVVCEAILCHEDPKNYHVWLHRSWFIAAFSFLLQIPRNWDEWRTFLGTRSEISYRYVIDNPTAMGFAVHPSWKKDKCKQLPLPPCPLADEVNFTSHMIQEDRLNNSAWCHRFLVIKEHLIAALLQRYHTQLQHGQQNQTDAATLKDAIGAVCRLEVEFGLQWAVIDPTNECAFVHARIVAELYQTVMLRLLLLDRALEDTSASREYIDFLLLSELSPPLASVCTHHCLSEDPCSADGMQWERLRASEESHTNSSQSPRNFPYSINNFVHRLRELSWNEYLDTFVLLRFQAEVLRTHVVLQVEKLQRAFEAASLDGPSTTQEGIGPARAAMYANSSQFMLDNMWQTVAAQYHSAFIFLEQTWLLYGDSAFKASVAQSRQPELYIVRGVSPDMRMPISAKGEDTKLATITDFFLSVEAEALYLAKRLVLEDPIRKKYWKHELWTVLYRRY